MRVRSIVYNFANDARRVLSIVDSPQFRDAYEASEDKAKADALIMACLNPDYKIRDQAIETLRIWMRYNRSQTSLGEMRAEAARLGVRNYARITREELKEELLCLRKRCDLERTPSPKQS